MVNNWLCDPNNTSTMQQTLHATSERVHSNSNVGYHGLTMLCACTYLIILKISVLHHCQMTMR